MENEHKYIYVDQDLLKTIYDKNNITPNDFYGDVLFIGMGDLYFPKKIDVNSITIVEKYSDVIELQKSKIPKEWTIIQEDGYVFETERKYDVIMLDMWYYMITKEELNQQIKRYMKFLNDGGKILYLETIKLNLK